jgi:hypothetical protein
MSTPRQPGGPRDPDEWAGEPSDWGRPPIGGWGAPGYPDAGYGESGHRDAGYPGYADGLYGGAGEGLYGYGNGSYAGNGYPAYADQAGYPGAGQPHDEPRYEWEAAYAPDPRGTDAYPAEQAVGRHASGHAATPAEPPWGQPYPQRPRRAAPSRTSRLPWVLAGVAAAVVAAVFVLGFVVPGWFVTRVLDSAAVQEGVAVVLTDDYGADGVADVRCPGSVEIVAGASFTCEATIDGDPITVPVRITNDDGGYEVGRPV